MILRVNNIINVTIIAKILIKKIFIVIYRKQYGKESVIMSDIVKPPKEILSEGDLLGHK